MITLNQTSDAARALGVCDKTVRRLVARGVLKPSAQTRSGERLFDDDDIERAKRELELTGQRRQ